MLHSCLPCQSTPSFYLAINIDVFDENKLFHVPIYPKIGEIVECNSKVIMKVKKINCSDSMSVVVGNPLKKINARLRLWKEMKSSVSVPVISIVAVISFQTTRANNKYILGYS